MRTIVVFIGISLLFTTTTAGFNPDVRWTCAESFVSIFVRTETPFQGVIVPRGIDNDDCLTRGDGANVAALRLPLVDGRCGISFDPSEDTFRLSLDVRAHPVLIVDHDKHLNISCRVRHDDRKTTNTFTLEVLDGEIRAKTVEYASTYKLKVTGRERQNFSVGPCAASGGSNVSVQLSDRRGCSLLPSLLSHFSRGEGSLSAQLPSMFRFPNTNSVSISCHVTLCDGACEEIDCEKKDSFAAALLDQTTDGDGSDHNGIDLEDDSSMAMGTVVVMEKGRNRQVTVPEQATPTAEPQCPRPVDIDLLYALCIILTVCSAIGFTINVCFCCAVWCRKGKIATKRPVIKDNVPDFWIMEQKPAPQPEPPIDRRVSTVSYASVKQKPRRTAIPVVEYGVPTSRNSDSSSGYSGDIYRRPDHSVRLSSSTFMSPSLTMETDLDSSISSNQTSSYH